MSSYSIFKSILAPRSQSTFLFTALKIVLSLFFIVQLLIILLFVMITLFQLQFDHLLDLFLTFGLTAVTFFGIAWESLSILIISTVYFLICFFDSLLNHPFMLVSYTILFFNALGLLLFSYLTNQPGHLPDAS